MENNPIVLSPEVLGPLRHALFEYLMGKTDLEGEGRLSEGWVKDLDALRSLYCRIYDALGKTSHDAIDWLWLGIAERIPTETLQGWTMPASEYAQDIHFAEMAQWLLQKSQQGPK